MPGTAVIPRNIGEGNAHLSGFSRSGGLATILESILLDMRDIAEAHNSHDHGGAVAAPDQTSPLATATVGTKFEDE